MSAATPNPTTHAHAKPAAPAPGSPEARAAVAAGNAESAKLEAAGHYDKPEAEVKPEAEEESFLILVPELATQTAPKHARSEAQVKMDAHVKRLHETWVKAGKPAGAWNTLVTKGAVGTKIMDPSKTAEERKRISRSAAFLGLRAKFGNPIILTPELARRYKRPESDVGKEILTVAIMDKTTRAASPAASAGKPAEAAK